MGPGEGYLLEAGCGAGGNLTCLRADGYRVVGLEPNARLASLARRRAHCTIYEDGLPGGMSVVREDVRCALLLDVLEHIADEATALDEMHDRLPPGGHLIVTVPALPFLWSYHDESFGHHRRYTRQDLRRKLEAAGFAVEWCSHFNSLLLAPAFCVRFARKALGATKGRTDFWLPPYPINSLLAGLLGLECRIISQLGSPLGLSLAAVARK